MDKILTKEEIEYIKTSGIVDNLYTIKTGHYKRNTTTSMNNAVADIVDKYSDSPTNRKNFSCGKCVYNLYEKLMNLYYSSIEYYDKVECETEPTTISSEDKKVVTNKEKKVPKYGTKTKSNKGSRKQKV